MSAAPWRAFPPVSPPFRRDSTSPRSRRRLREAHLQKARGDARRRAAMRHEDREMARQRHRQERAHHERRILVPERHRRHEADAHPGPHGLLHGLHPGDLQRDAHRRARLRERALDELAHAGAFLAQHQRIPGERIERHAAVAGGERMAGGHDRDDLVLVPRMDRGAGRQRLARRAFDHRDVERRQRGHHLGRVAAHGLDRHARRERLERGDQVWQQVARRRRARPHAQRAGLEAAHRVAERARLREGLAQRPRVLRELFAGRRQADAATVALVQRLAEFVLELAKLPGHGRLRQMQRQRRMADVAVLGDRRESYQLVRGHGAELSDFRIVYVTNDNFSYPYIEIRIKAVQRRTTGSRHVHRTDSPSEPRRAVDARPAERHPVRRAVRRRRDERVATARDRRAGPVPADRRHRRRRAVRQRAARRHAGELGGGRQLLGTQAAAHRRRVLRAAREPAGNRTGRPARPDGVGAGGTQHARDRHLGRHEADEARPRRGAPHRRRQRDLRRGRRARVRIDAPVQAAPERDGGRQRGAVRHAVDVPVPARVPRGLAAPRPGRPRPVLRRYDPRGRAGGRCGERHQPAGRARGDHRQDDPRDAAGAGAAGARRVARPLGAGRRRARQAQGRGAVVRARLPRVRDRQFAERAAGRRHAHTQRARHLRADDGDDRARHRNPHFADPRSRPPCADDGPDPVRVAGRGRLRHHLGRAALAWLNAGRPIRAPRPPGPSGARGAMLFFASVSLISSRSCFRSC
ncbi:protein of unknown function [Burkholderia multivorans]